MLVLDGAGGDPAEGPRRQRDRDRQAGALQPAPQHRAAMVERDGHVARLLAPCIADDLREATRVEAHALPRPDWLQPGVHLFDCLFLFVPRAGVPAFRVPVLPGLLWGRR